MTEKQTIKPSNFLSLILRHEPARLGVKLDNAGWKLAILRIRAADMHHAGYIFYQSANGVWLVESVPPQFIEFPDRQNAS